MKIIFIVPSISDSHYRNRIVEFIENGYSVDVYGFERKNINKKPVLPYSVNVIGSIEDESYIERVKLYIKEFRKLGKRFNQKDDIFYLCGLDIAIFFHYVNPKFQYLYEECDLTHTYTKIKKLLEFIDLRIIKTSLLTILTSEGFINYHFNGEKPHNVCLVENKLNPAIVEYTVSKRKPLDRNSISIGFVGGPRFDSVFNFIDVYCRTFPQHTFHIFGGPVPKQFETLRKYKNCIFHGFFTNPNDLPEIYSKIDLVLSTYDTKYENVRFAEPNKIYECLYFEAPIIVSSNTFLAEKVNRLGIGYDIDAMDDNAIIKFVNRLSQEEVKKKSDNAHLIDKKETININTKLFDKLKSVIHSCQK